MTFPEPLRSFWYAALSLEETFHETPWGAVVADSRYPGVHEANHASVLEPAEDLEMAEVLAALLPALRSAGAHAEHIEFMDADDDCPALRSLRESTDDQDSDVAMVFERARTRPNAPAGFELGEVSQPDERFWSFYRVTPNEYADPLPAAVLDQMLARIRDVFVPAGLRFYAATADGDYVGFASVLSLEGVSYVDNVVTLPAFRRRGIATAAVTMAVQAALDAGDGTVFLLADERGAPRTLYERLGFRVRCRCQGFTRALPRGGGR